MSPPLVVDVVVPVYNEEDDVPKNIPILRDFLAGPDFLYGWRIVISDNGSTDRTPEVSRLLEERYPGEVTYSPVSGRGKGRAVKEAWAASEADIVSFMDVDLSTALTDFPCLIDAVARDGYDFAIGTRLHPDSRTRGRSLRRRVTTRVYNTLVKSLFGIHFGDAQCGFKAASTEAAHRLLPLVEDIGWFFDTELLVIAEKAGYRIREVPVTWAEDERTSVAIISTIAADLRGLARLRRTRPWRSAPRREARTEAHRTR